MKPYFEAEGITLYHGDSLAVLADLEPASADVMFTDPPYSSGGMVRGDRTTDVHTKYVNSDSVSGAALTAFTGDNRDQRGYLVWSALWLSESLRVVRTGGVAGLFTDWRQLPVTTDAFQAGGYVWRGLIPWHKPASRPQQGRFTNSCEYLVWGTNGSRSLEGSPFPGFYSINSPRSNEREHITQKPLSLMRELLAICPPDGRVLDPFAGSGTTLLAARQLGLQAIGIELSEHFCEIIATRLSQGGADHRRAATGDLFAQEAAS